MKIGPYREVYETHLSNFQSLGYSVEESAALAQSVVARPLPKVTEEQKSDYFESSIPNAELVLENLYEGISQKVQDAVSQNYNLFRDNDDPIFCEAIVNGVYPGMVVVHNKTVDSWYAADWTLTESSEIKISNVRDIGTYYDTLALAVTEALEPAVDLVQYGQLLPLQIEEQYLCAVVSGLPFTSPKAQLDGNRPIEEMEFVKYLRTTKALTEAMSQTHVMPGGLVTPKISTADAIARLAVVGRKIRQLENTFFNAKMCLARPALGSPMSEKSTTLQTVVISKDKFSKFEAAALAKRNGWGTNLEESSDSYRFLQHAPDSCQDGSLRTITLKEGVKAISCKLKSSPKTERRLNESGDYSTLGGHSVYVDNDDASKGDMSGVEKQIKTHNRMAGDLADEKFKKVASAGWGQGETWSKDGGNGYSTDVTLQGGKAHTTVKRHGAVHKVIGTATNSPQLAGHIADATSAVSAMPVIAGYEDAEPDGDAD